MKTILTIIIISLIHVVSASYLKLNDVIDTVNMFRNEISVTLHRTFTTKDGNILFPTVRMSGRIGCGYDHYDHYDHH